MEPGTFETIPLVRLQKRRLAGAGGDRGGDDAVAVVRGLAAKGLVAVSDLDGLRRNKADLDTLRKMADKGNVWADAGSRFGTDVMDLLVAGAERATVRWSRLASEAELREAAEMSDSLWLGLEFEPAFARNPLLAGDERSVLALARDLGVGVVVIDARPADAVRGFDASLGLRFEGTGVDRWYQGPARAADVGALESIGFRGLLAPRELLGAP